MNDQRKCEVGVSSDQDAELELADDRLAECRYCGRLNRTDHYGSNGQCCDPTPPTYPHWARVWRANRPTRDLAAWCAAGGYDTESIG